MPLQQHSSRRRTIWRRRLVAIGALLGVAVLAWVLLRDGGVLGPVDKRGAQVAHLAIDSEAVGRSSYQSRSSRRRARRARSWPLLVFLHGRGPDGEDSNLDEPMYAALAEQRRQGADRRLPQRRRGLLLAQPRLGRLGGLRRSTRSSPRSQTSSAPTRSASPSAASRWAASAPTTLPGSNPGRFCAVGGHSPALWATAGETARGRGSTMPRTSPPTTSSPRFPAHPPSPFTSQWLWLDIGDSDPFIPGTESLHRPPSTPLARRSSDHRSPGGHEERLLGRATGRTTCASTRTRSRGLRTLASDQTPGSHRPRARCDHADFGLSAPAGEVPPAYCCTEPS